MRFSSFGPAVSAVLIIILSISCTSLQQDTRVTTADGKTAGEIDTLASVIVPLDRTGDARKIMEAREMVRALERKDIQDTVFEAQLLAWSGRLSLLEGAKPEAQRALRRAQILSAGETAVTVLESRLEGTPEKRLVILNERLGTADIPAALEIERARALEELYWYREAVAAYDAAFPALPPYYRETYTAARDRCWELRDLSPGSAAMSGNLALKPEITLNDALVLIRDGTPLLNNSTGGALWSSEKIYRDLNARGIIPVEPVGTVRLQDTITRAHAAWLLWQLNAEYRSQPTLKTRYSDRIRTLPNPRSPIRDVPYGSRWFDAVLGCVEWEIMNLPDGKNFFPDNRVSGVSFMEMLKQVK